MSPAFSAPLLGVAKGARNSTAAADWAGGLLLCDSLPLRAQSSLPYVGWKDKMSRGRGWKLSRAKDRVSSF